MGRKKTPARRAPGSSDEGGKTKAARRPRRPPPGPPLFELRRRARARLRELSEALRTLQQEYREAADQCDRLKAARPDDVLGSLPASPEAKATGPPASAEQMEPLRALAARVQALEERLCRALAALTEEQSACHEIQEARDALARQLREAEQRLGEEQSTAEAREARVRELEDRVRHFQEDSRQSSNTSEAWQQRVAAIQADLTQAQAANARLREDMSSLLRFLDELNTILAPAAPTD